MESEKDVCEISEALDELLSAAKLNLLPKLSHERYTKCYEKFVEWKQGKGVTFVNEDIMLAYFQEQVRF